VRGFNIFCFEISMIDYINFAAGMKSTEFALALFDALARRENVSGDSINMNELKEFWKQITDQDFDSRLRTFFAM